MANKTPPLVIPVVIDSTGVDKGLSNVGSRLRRGVSGTGAGGGSGGGFGAGGALAAAALGAGVAAAAGRGVGGLSGFNKPTTKFGMGYSSTNTANLPSNMIDKIRRSTLVGRHMVGAADTLLKYRTAFQVMGQQTNDPLLSGLFGSAGNLMHYGRTNLLRGATAVGMQARNARRAGIAKPYNAMVSGVESLLSLRGALGATGVVAAGAAGLRFAQNFRQNTSDISNLVGSPLYGQMRGVQLRNYQSGPQPTLLQNFLGGGMKANRNKETYLEKDVKAIVEATGGFFNDLGGAYEMGRGNGIMAGIGYLWQATINRAAMKGYGL